MLPRFYFLLLLAALSSVCFSGRHSNKHGSNKLMELLTAGIVAKVLQKNDDEGGGGQGYYPIPIPLPMGGGGGGGGYQARHHHVTEKIIPIPIPHHTTRIIHINAGSPHVGGMDDGIDGGFDHHGGGGGGGYDDHHQDIGPAGGDHHPDDHHHRHAPTVQQLLFHDGGVYGAPQPLRRPIPPRHPHPIHMRRPIVGMPPPRHPMMRPLPVPGLVHPSPAAAHPQMVRVRHYYALPHASTRNRMLVTAAHPLLHQQQRYRQMLLMQQKRYPRPWYT